MDVKEMQETARSEMKATRQNRQTTLPEMEFRHLLEKKGNAPSWRPADRLGFLDVPQGFTGRWCSRDDANVQKKLAEGWKFVNKTVAPQAEHRKPGPKPKTVEDGARVGGAITYREMVGMMLPIEDVHGNGQCKKVRDEYFHTETVEKTLSRIRATRIKSAAGKYSGNITSSLTIGEGANAVIIE